MMSKDKRLGLALSGGGYRAAAFHLGTLKALHRMGLLNQVEVISTVSGGSIVGADYVLNGQADFESFNTSHRKKLQRDIIKIVIWKGLVPRVFLPTLIVIASIVALQFTCVYWIGYLLLLLYLIVLIKYQFKIFPVSKIISSQYDKIFFQDKKLPDLPSRPLISINSTNLETGRPFSFSHDYMGDSTYSYLDKKKTVKFHHSRFKISEAVMASSSVPFAFTPVEIDNQFIIDEEFAFKFQPVLVDGGVFDNQGAHKLTHPKSRYSCNIVVVSDAGNKMPFQNDHSMLITLAFRVVDLFMNRIKMFQMVNNLYNNTQLNRHQMAFVSLGWDIENCIEGFINAINEDNVLPSQIEAHQIPTDLLVKPVTDENRMKIKQILEHSTNYKSIKARSDAAGNYRKTARAVSTNLKKLSDSQLDALALQAELLTELQVKLYCVDLLPK